MFSKDIGIDLGTANTLVYLRGKGIIMREPSVVAVDTKTDDVRSVGHEAKAVIGRTPGSIVAVRPLKDGVIADFDITANMLSRFIKKVCGNSMFFRPRVVICIPSGVTEVERRAVKEASLKAGARHRRNSSTKLSAKWSTRFVPPRKKSKSVSKCSGSTTASCRQKTRPRYPMATWGSSAISEMMRRVLMSALTLAQGGRWSTA